MKRLAAIFLGIAAVTGAQAQSLTGVVWYTTDSGMHYNGGYANTYGGDTYSRNLYVTENTPVGSGPLLNSQNLTTMPTRINVSLANPGTYTFQMYCNGDSSTIAPWWGLNLFFDGDDKNAKISAWNAVDSAGFQAMPISGTPSLNPLTMGTNTTGVGGGLQAVLDGKQITLTNYQTWSASHYNLDRVDDFSDAGGIGNGTKDQVIEFTVKVTPVPEPASIAGLAALSIGFLGRRQRKTKLASR